jgi:hypothetical protein
MFLHGKFDAPAKQAFTKVHPFKIWPGDKVHLKIIFEARCSTTLW